MNQHLVVLNLQQPLVFNIKKKNMKKLHITSIITCCFLALVFTQCKEIGPAIEFTPPAGLVLDSAFTITTIPAAMPKKVLIEEFSGVHCPNCPNGQKRAKEIIDANNGKVIGVTMHINSGNPLVKPYTVAEYANAQDFRTQFASDINAQFGPYGGIPCAMVDRKYFTDISERLMMSTNTWEPKVNIQKALTAPVNIAIQNFWNETPRTVASTITLQFTQVIANNPSISVMLVEDDIDNPQEFPTGDQHSYIHHHVLRTMLTAGLGKAINHDTSPGNGVVYKFLSNPLPANWNPDNIKVVVLVNETTGAAAQVLQVEQKSIK
jgi:hypothetical protein